MAATVRETGRRVSPGYVQRDLTKLYGDKVAVDDLTFTVQPGTVTGFLGPNGAGKSITIRMILGLDNPTAGTVTVNGRRLAGHAASLCEAGALLEAKAVHSGRTVRGHGSSPRSPASPSGPEVGEDGEHPAVLGVVGRQAELGEDAADVFFYRAGGDDQPLGDGRVGVALGHQRQQLAFPCGERLQGVVAPLPG